MKSVLQAFNELKENGLIRDYAIGGAIAALRWTEPFFTQDLDIFVVLFGESEKGLVVLSPIYEYLASRGWAWQGHWMVTEGIPVDIFPADPLEEEAVREAAEVEYEGVRTKVITPEYLIPLFLRAGRDKDILKIRMLLEQAEVDLERLKEIATRFGLYDRWERLQGLNPSKPLRSIY